MQRKHLRIDIKEYCLTIKHRFIRYLIMAKTTLVDMSYSVR